MMNWTKLLAGIALVAGANAQNCGENCLECSTFRDERCTKCVDGYYNPDEGPDCVPIEGEDPDDDRRVYIDVKGNSGRIALALQEDVNSDPNRIMITMDSLRELAADKTAVGNNSPNQHSVENFAQLDFTYSDVERTTYPGTELSVDLVSFEAEVQDGATFRVNTYYFFEGGVIENDDEEVNVSDGTVKFTVDIENWTWCQEGGQGWSSCMQGQQEQVGEFLEFGITVQTKSRMKEEEEEESLFSNQEEDVKVSFSQKAYIDADAWVDIDEPAHDLTGNTDRFTLVFPKFEQSLSYDPTVQYSEELLRGTPGPASAPLYIAAGMGGLLVVGAGVYAYKKQEHNKAAQGEGQPLV